MCFFLLFFRIFNYFSGAWSAKNTQINCLSNQSIDPLSRTFFSFPGYSCSHFLLSLLFFPPLSCDCLQKLEKGYFRGVVMETRFCSTLASLRLSLSPSRTNHSRTSKKPEEKQRKRRKGWKGWKGGKRETRGNMEELFRKAWYPKVTHYLFAHIR